MNRYYILTEREGVRVLGATTVDETVPHVIRFLGDTGIESFDRRELLWWGDVESSPPAPFSDFGGPDPRGHSRRSPRPQSPWGAHEVWTNEGQRNANDGRLAAAIPRALDALVDAVRASVPTGWRVAVLELKVSYALPEYRYKVTHRIRNPETGVEAFDFSNALFVAIEVFHRINVEGGQCWNQSALTLHLDDMGRCGSAQVNHDYGTNFGPR